MSYEILEPPALDYYPCRYGTSKLIFRGPRRDLREPYVAFIGGTQTYGKFIEQPFPLKVEHLTGVPSVNFGQVSAGLDVFAKDVFVQEAARGARVTVLEVLGAANLSNRLYTVHTRRNDRFLRASAELQKLFPKTDFTQFNFTQHMLIYLMREDENRFAVLKRSLQRVWTRRMRQLLHRLGPKVVLLRIAAGPFAADTPEEILGYPALVTDDMLDGLSGYVSAIVDIPIEAQRGLQMQDGMAFDAHEADAAGVVAPPSVHTAVAKALCPVLDQLM
jgi:hypothetical protein